MLSLKMGVAKRSFFIVVKAKCRACRGSAAALAATLNPRQAFATAIFHNNSYFRTRTSLLVKSTPSPPFGRICCGIWGKEPLQVRHL